MDIYTTNGKPVILDNKWYQSLSYKKSLSEMIPDVNELYRTEDSDNSIFQSLKEIYCPATTYALDLNPKECFSFETLNPKPGLGTPAGILARSRPQKVAGSIRFWMLCSVAYEPRGGSSTLGVCCRWTRHPRNSKLKHLF